MKFVQVPEKYFEMATTLVTQNVWLTMMGSNPSRFKDLSRPVENVSYDDVQEFLRVYNAANTDHDYFLPSKKELKSAAKAGAQTDFFWGNDVSQLDDYAWIKENSKGITQPVGLKKPNPWGIYDFLGNVFCLSRSFADPGLNMVVVRGGSFDTSREGFGHIKKFVPRNAQLPDLGFRLIRVKKENS